MSNEIRKIVRRPQLRANTGLSNSHLYDIANPRSPNFDPSFPVAVKLGPRAVGWFEDEVNVWLASRPRVRDLPKMVEAANDAANNGDHHASAKKKAKVAV